MVVLNGSVVGASPTVEPRFAVAGSSSFALAGTVSCCVDAIGGGPPLLAGGT